MALSCQKTTTMPSIHTISINHSQTRTAIRSKLISIRTRSLPSRLSDLRFCNWLRGSLRQRTIMKNAQVTLNWTPQKFMTMLRKPSATNQRSILSSWMCMMYRTAWTDSGMNRRRSAPCLSSTAISSPMLHTCPTSAKPSLDLARIFTKHTAGLQTTEQKWWIRGPTMRTDTPVIVFSPMKR